MNRDNNKRLSRTGRILLISGIAVAVLLGAWFGIQAWLGREVTKLLESEPLNLDGSAYITDVGRVRVDLARRSVTLHGVSVKTQKNSRTRKQGPVPVLEARAEKVSASGIHYRKGRDTVPGALHIRSLEVSAPEVIFEGVPCPEGDTCRTAAAGKRNKPMKIDIERFGISGATIHAGIWEGSEKNNFTAEGLDLTLLRLSFGSGIPKETLRQADSVPAGVSAVSLSVRTLAYVFKNGALKMEADTLSLDSGKGILSAGRLALLPQYDKYQYAVRVGDHTDWVMLDVREIACSGVSLPYLSGHDMLHADSVSVGSVEIDSYKDRNQLQSPAFRQMLYTSVQRIPVGIDFPVIDARGINIRYEEVSKGATVPGVVTFTDMDARITGLTNRPQKPTQQYRIYAEGYMFGGALVKTTLSLPADSSNDRFSLKAEVGPMSATIASPVTEPIANVRIVSGDLHSVNVELSGSSVKAQSVVDMRYNNLQIAILHKKDPERERELLTTIANGMVLHRDNPEGGKLRIGHGFYERDPQKSFWNYLWKTSFAGVTDIVM